MTTLAPVRYPAFRYLVAGDVVTTLGSAMAPIALAFAVLDLTGSVTALGIVVGTRSLTNVLFLLFGGVVADRLPRQLVVVASSTVAGLSQGAAALLVLGHWASVPLLAVLAGVNGIAASFGFPATAALVPQTVPAPIRKQANALNRLGINSSMIVGAALGGVLVAAFGPGWGLVIDALSFLVSAGCFALVRVAPVPPREHRSTLHELRDGWREFISRTWVWVVVLAFCFINAAVVAGIQVLGPAVADQTIGRRLWGLVLAAHTAGMVAGAVVALRSGGGRTGRASDRYPDGPARRGRHRTSGDRRHAAVPAGTHPGTRCRLVRRATTRGQRGPTGCGTPARAPRFYPRSRVGELLARRPGRGRRHEG